MHDDLTLSIAADLGIADLPANEQQTLIAQFGEIALKAAALAVASNLSEEKRDEFARLAEAGDPAALKSFLDKEVPDHEVAVRTAVADEVARFKAFQAKSVS